jgi:hypothetical protein
MSEGGGGSVVGAAVSGLGGGDPCPWGLWSWRDGPWSGGGSAQR